MILGAFYSIDDMKIDEKQRFKLKSLISYLQGFIKEIESINFIKDQALFFMKIENLWDYIKNYQDQEIVSFFLHTQEFKKIQEKCVNFHSLYERALETKESIIITSEVFKNNDRYLDEFAHNSFLVDNYKIVKNEFELLERKNPKQLVMVGCGPLPETILFLLDNTNIEEIIGIDSNQEAVFLAGEVLNALGHGDRAKVKYAYGEEYNYIKADTIHVANAVHNKQSVLDRIAKTAKKGAEVLVRNPSGLFSICYQDTYSVPTSFLVKQIDNIISIQGDSYLLLEKFNY